MEEVTQEKTNKQKNIVACMPNVQMWSDESRFELHAKCSVLGSMWHSDKAGGP